MTTQEFDFAHESYKLLIDLINKQKQIIEQTFAATKAAYLMTYGWKPRTNGLWRHPDSNDRTSWSPLHAVSIQKKIENGESPWR